MKLIDIFDRYADSNIIIGADGICETVESYRFSIDDYHHEDARDDYTVTLNHKLYTVTDEGYLKDYLGTILPSAYTEPVPVHLLCYIVNGDDSGLSDDDIAIADRLVTDIGEEIHGTTIGEPYFDGYQDVIDVVINPRN